MPNYKKLYYEIFNQVSDVITALQKIQQNAESNFIDDEPAPFLTLTSNDDNDNENDDN